MNKPLFSWKKTISSLGYKVIWGGKNQSNKKREKERTQQQYGALEPRQMLAGDTGLVVQANLAEVFATIQDPLVVRTGQLNNDPSIDAAILSANGQLTIATNGDDDTWQTRQTIDLATGPVFGMELARVDDDLFQDLIIQGSDSLFIATNDGNGQFEITQTLTSLGTGDLASSNGDPLRIATGFFNADTHLDIAAVSPGSDQLVIYLGVGDGMFMSSIIESTGGSTPTSLASGDFVGNGFPDFAIGHADGVVTLVENLDGGSFVQRLDLAVGGFDQVADLATDDLDQDGDLDIVVASVDQLTILQNNQVEDGFAPVFNNAAFERGLVGWNTEIVGHRNGSTAGSVIAQSGFAQLIENESFLVSVNQDFVVPDSPDKIQVDILSLGLEDPAGGIPDAFEISILDADGNSVLPTFRPDATSLFNVNPGTGGDDNIVKLATGVSFDGTTVTIDISGLAVGAAATIYFDLIGNGPGSGSTATIDNVRITPDNEFDSELELTTLAGPFINANRLAIDDVDGDGRLDIVAIDAGIDTLLIFNGRADQTFDREEIDLSSTGTGLISLDTAPLTSGDDVSDIVVVAEASELLLSPLTADAIAPSAALQSPIANTTNTGSITQIDVVFDEPMRNLGADDTQSVIHTDNYLVTFLGADGVVGTVDDVELTITDVQYDSLTSVATVNIDPTSTPLEDGVYIVTLDSGNLRDASDNPLSDGDSVEFQFTLNSAGPAIAPTATVTSVEGDVVLVTANFTDNGGATPYTAQIDWGDGSVTAANMVDFASGDGMLTASHIYADDGNYNITLTVQDDNGVATQGFTNAIIENVDPIVTPASSVPTVVTGQTFTLQVAEFTDAGFDNINTGDAETFTATINWGDGTTTDGTVSRITGMPGIESTGTVEGNHSYASPGTYTITVAVSDDDGGTDTATFEISDLDDVPVLVSADTINGNEGAVTTITATFADQGNTSGTYTAIVDWGDGSSTPANVTYSGNAGTIDATHTYADNGSYTITYTLTDPDSNSVSGTTGAAISNSAPVLTVAANQSAEVGAELNLTVGTFTDSGFTNDAAGTSETFAVFIDWGDGQTSTPDATVTQGSAGTPTNGSIDEAHIYSAPGNYLVTVSVADDDGETATDTFTILVTSNNAGIWLPNIDFDFDADGNEIGTGEVVSEQWAAWGVHITSDSAADHPAMIFDSANPTGGDDDLASSTQNNILIISEDGDASDPDDKASGGTLIFNFDTPVMLDDVGLMDIESSETVTLRTFDVNGNAIGVLVVDGAGDSTEQIVALSALNVSTLEIEMSASGAVTDLIFCRNIASGSNAEISGLETVNEGSPYTLALNYTGANLDRWVVNWGDGNVETITANQYPTHTFADGDASSTITAFAYDTDGSVYAAESLDVEILNVAPTLTIDGNTTIEEGQTFTLDLSSTDPGDDTITQWIIDWGDGTEPQIVNGNPNSVEHTFNTAGEFTIKAQAFDEDSTLVVAGSELGIRARGTIGGERFNLIIDGQVVQTFTATTQFQRFAYSADRRLTPADVRIEFINDFYDSSTNSDSNLRIDNIDIDARIYETEADDVWSTGTWKSGDGITAGFRNSEWLHANGYFDFDAVAGTKIDIWARGNEGGEAFNILIDDVVVASFVATTYGKNFQYNSSQTVAANQIKIQFTNDLWDPSNGVDRNLYVDNIKLDGNVYETEAPSTYSTGTWLPEDGTQPGFRESAILTSNGYLHYDALPTHDPLVMDPYCSNEFTVTVTESQPIEAKLPNIDFEFDGDGVKLNAGNVISDQFAAIGVHVTTNDPINHPAMIFDSARPTGEDYDLGTPSELYGGPGVGHYGEFGESNTTALNNILIISEDANSHDPDDNEQGGTLIFTFDQATTLDEVGLLDISGGDVTFRLYDNSDHLILEQSQAPIGENEVQRVVLNATNVAKMEIIFAGLGAVTDIEFCRTGSHIQPARTKFVTVDRDTNSAYRYDASGNQLDGFGIVHNAATQGVATTPSGDPIWVLKSNEWVYVYQGEENEYQGRWDAQGPVRGKGIASDGTDVWIVGNKHDRVYYYAGAAAYTSGSYSATSTFALHSQNYNPQGLTVKYDKLWVTDASSDRVFVYNTDGDFLGKWSLDAANGRSSGITTDTSGENIWVTDYDDGVIYYYEGAGSRLSGSQSATSVIQLPANNQRPEGIADPATPINLDQEVIGTINNAGEQFEYSFDVSAGERVFFDVMSGSAFFRWNLVSPSGQQTFSTTFQDRDTTELLESGTYILTVGSESNTRTGSFSFRLWDVPQTPTTSIDLDQVVDGAITTPGESVQYQLAATAGDNVVFDVQAGSPFFGWNLVSPSGDQVFSSSTFRDQDVVELPETGAYTLTVGKDSNSRTGSFTFEAITIVPPEVRPLNLGIEATGVLEQRGARDVWTFSAQAGEELYLDVTEVSDRTGFAVIGPDGQVIESTNIDGVVTNLDRVNITLPTTGQYQLEVRSDIDRTPEYSFIADFVPEPNVTDLVIDEYYQGTLETLASVDLWNFAASQGQQVFVDFLEVNNGFIDVSILGPNGATLFQTENSNPFRLDSGVIVLPADGMYTLRVEQALSRPAENYQFRIIDIPLADSLEIQLDQWVAGDIDLPGQMPQFTFVAEAGTPLTVDLAYNGVERLGDSVGYTLTSPTGVTLLDRQQQNQTISSLPETGSYTITFAQASSVFRDRTDEFNFRIVSSDTVTPVVEASNLVVTSIVNPQQVTGNPAVVEITWTVTNQGNQTTPSSTWVDRIVISADRSYGELADIDDRRQGDFVHVGQLAPGESYTQTGSITLPADFNGEFEVVVVADALNEVDENVDETDNFSFADHPTAVYKASRDLSSADLLTLDVENNSIFPAGQPLNLSGQATTVAGATNLIFVIDVSGSAYGVTGLDANFDGVVDELDDLNGDGEFGSIVDAQIAGILAAVEQASEQSDNLRVASIIFSGGGAIPDQSPAIFNQTFVDPLADGNGNSIADFEETLRSNYYQASLFAATSGTTKFRETEFEDGTDFNTPLELLTGILQRSQNVQRTEIIFMTDGQTQDPVDGNLVSQIAAADVSFKAFQITGDVITPELQALSDQINSGISTGSAQLVTDANDLRAELLATRTISDVTVNGSAVTLLDANGNFSTPVTLLPGENSFIVESFGSSGLLDTRTVTLIGTTGGVQDINSLIEVDDLQEQYTHTTFNRKTNQLHTKIAVQNSSDFDYASPITGLFSSFDTASVALAADISEGQDDAGSDYILFDAELENGLLSSGDSSAVIAISFDNSLRQRFGVDVDFLVQPNIAPIVTSTPLLVSPVDVDYQYAVEAIDLNGDFLSFTILSGPNGLTLDSTNAGIGLLNWQPTVVDIGNHQVAVLIEDGRGGSVEHQFNLSVPSGLENQAPLILSQPDSLATVDKVFEYLIDAIDPEGDDAILSLGADTPLGVAISGNLLTYTPEVADIGLQKLTVIASDSEGATSTQTFELDVRDINTNPVFVSTPVTEAVIGTRYRYRAIAIDNEDSVTYSLVQPVSGVEIDEVSGVVTIENVSVDQAFVIRATDDRGLFTEQSVAVTVNDDTTAPSIVIVNDNTVFNVGDTYRFRVALTDDGVIDETSLIVTVNGTAVILDANQVGSIEVAETGFVEVTAEVADTSGNLGTTQSRVRVIDPADRTAPFVEINSPINFDTVTYLTDVVATVTSDGDLDRWTVDYSLTGQENWQRLASGNTDLSNEVAAVFDPTLLANDNYDIRISASDFSGNQFSIATTVAVDGQAKLGNFATEFTDLQIPLAGIPITITRQYDTLNVQDSLDFGYGW